jgi:hypothetical protein
VLPCAVMRTVNSAVITTLHGLPAHNCPTPLCDGFQVMSRAQAVEWVTLGAVRYAGLPDTAPCKWGGTEPSAPGPLMPASAPAPPPTNKA